VYLRTIEISQPIRNESAGFLASAKVQDAKFEYGADLIEVMTDEQITGIGEVHSLFIPSGVLLEAIDISKFTPISQFEEKVDALLKVIRSSRKAPDNKRGEILEPGDKEYMTMEKRLREGIQIEDATWQAIKKTAQELNVNIGAIVSNARAFAT
jgi:LDH2 family malate/lactate/ureidoglycolate dehydrogenase